jgi:FkbM family methyltransferase
MYSQSSEELFILDYFGKKIGKFIDIGSYDVFRFSNVRALYERGWSGVLVEPQPENFNAIYEHYKNDPKITTLNCAIGDKNGEIDFYESNGDAVGTTNEEHMEKWGASGVKYTKIKVLEIDIADFMEEHCVGIDFISIDTESTNMTLFRRIPDFVFQQISMFCIEYDNGKDEIEERLSKFGFNTLYVNAENIILAK